jgi:hypothetical protein
MRRDRSSAPAYFVGCGGGQPGMAVGKPDGIVLGNVFGIEAASKP